METAGKLVDNDELRDALKENGIGRPSTRAAIIETLFKRIISVRKKEPDCHPDRSGVGAAYSRRIIEIGRIDRYLGKEVA